MVVTFLIYGIALVFVLQKRPNLAFILIALNLAISFLLLMHHSTDFFVSGV
ncbi:MAG: hypothetical protein ACD_17C00245G0003 [uncultured bacterium]|nr:MAG: hypothetical protein ACD_17C00245G0003 [uncultured bacterium]